VDTLLTDPKIETKTDPIIDTRAPAEGDAEKGQEELAQVLERAERGDKSVLGQLGRILDKSPGLWREYGDLALQAEAALGLRICGSNVLLGECIRRRLAELKAELGAASSAAERLLVEQVTSTWLQSHYYNSLMAQERVASPARLKVLQGLQDGAQRRHLAALKALAAVRKLLRPAPAPIDFAGRLGRPAAGARGDRVGVPARN